MFDSDVSFKYVQRDRRIDNAKTYLYKHIFKFFIKSKDSCRKYILIATEYENDYFTIDFYAKLGKNDTKDCKYRVLTNQKAFGRVASHVLSIMLYLETKFPNISFGMIAASLLGEENNATKRFTTYRDILSRVTFERFQVFAFEKNSFIFVILNKNLEQKDQIISDYGQIIQTNY